MLQLQHEVEVSCQLGQASCSFDDNVGATDGLSSFCVTTHEHDLLLFGNELQGLVHQCVQVLHLLAVHAC